MKSLEMMRRQRITKNNLKFIMNNNNWTSYYVSKKTGLSIKTIVNIKENQFSNINSDTLLTISENLNINLNDLIVPFDNGMPIKLFLDNPLLPKFDSLLVNILYQYTGVHFKIDQEYNNGHTINIRSQFFHKVHFHGNFLISSDETYGIYLEIRDFDFDIIKKYKNINIEKLVFKLINAIEHYAKNINIDTIIYDIEYFFRHDVNDSKYIFSYSNSDDCVINNLLRRKYCNLEENFKRTKINSYTELINKLKRHPHILLTKKIH